jgi:hypothetical protein
MEKKTSQSDTGQNLFMEEHDPRCERADDAKVLADVKRYGWHVVKILDKDQSPGWAFSIGIYKNFGHPEIILFGLDSELMHLVINTIGDEIKAGRKFDVEGRYYDLIDTYACTFMPVQHAWYDAFLGYANWFYDGTDYPVLQCFWPDRDHRYPWEPKFNPHWLWAQPLLFHEEASRARTTELLRSIEDE